MANTFNGNLWILDTVDVISTSPVTIKKIVLVPNAASDVATFSCWSEQSTPELAVYTATVTASGANTLASTGNFTTANVDPLDVLTITKSSTGNNLGSFIILTNADNNTVTVTAGDLTNETSKIYDYTVHTPYTQAYIKAPGTEVMSTELDFGHGREFKNLVLSTLSTSAKVYVYL